MKELVVLSDQNTMQTIKSKAKEYAPVLVSLGVIAVGIITYYKVKK